MKERHHDTGYLISRGIMSTICTFVNSCNTPDHTVVPLHEDFPFHTLHNQFAWGSVPHLRVAKQWCAALPLPHEWSHYTVHRAYVVRTSAGLRELSTGSRRGSRFDTRRLAILLVRMVVYIGVTIHHPLQRSLQQPLQRVYVHTKVFRCTRTAYSGGYSGSAIVVAAVVPIQRWLQCLFRSNASEVN